MNRSDTENTEDPLQRKPDPRTNLRSGLVIGAAIEVHRRLGPGYLESIYEEALAIELTLRQVPFEHQNSFDIPYKGQAIGEGRLDFLIDGCLVVELKAVEALAPIHHAQLISYLKANRLTLGLLLNFNVPTLKSGIRRVVLT